MLLVVINIIKTGSSWVIQTNQNQWQMLETKTLLCCTNRYARFVPAHLIEEGLVPIQVSGLENLCLYRSASLALWGDETHTQAIRLATLVTCCVDLQGVVQEVDIYYMYAYTVYVLSESDILYIFKNINFSTIFFQVVSQIGRIDSPDALEMWLAMTTNNTIAESVDRNRDIESIVRHVVIEETKLSLFPRDASMFFM